MKQLTWLGLFVLAGTLRSQTPAVAPNGLVNAASFAAPGAPNGSLAPGSIASLFGSDLAAAVQAAAVPLPKTLGDTDAVTIGLAAAPLFFVSGGQINLQIPFEAQPGTWDFAVTRAGRTSASRAVTIVPASPGIFIVDPSGQGAIVNTNGVLVDGNA